MEKRKRRLGDRADGWRVRNLDPLYTVSPYIMVERNDASNFIMDSVEISSMERYIRQKRREGLDGFGIMHVIIAAYVRVVSQRPAINRFISGQKIYARNNMEIMLAVKQDMTAESGETVIKIEPKLDATAEEIYELVKAKVEEGKQESDSSFDSLAKVINWIPGLLLKFTIWFLKLMDYFGIIPRFLTKLSPFHGSMFITSMGSLGIPPIFHHLYNFGNVPVFCAFGAKQKRYELQSDGTVAEKRFITYTWVTDERICDGFYYASALKLVRNILKNPEQLSERPDKVIADS